MLKTIKIPRNLMNLTSNLPKPKYFEEDAEDIPRNSRKTNYYSKTVGPKNSKKKKPILVKLKMSKEKIRKGEPSQKLKVIENSLQSNFY